mmetsp:Transcript_33743/g.84678  ORF Transcript_33743/g.84678 Transcript_33743/m.84678 type:complete len:273 (-) Transcript_33743:565-1383(-)
MLPAAGCGRKRRREDEDAAARSAPPAPPALLTRAQAHPKKLQLALPGGLPPPPAPRVDAAGRVRMFDHVEGNFPTLVYLTLSPEVQESLAASVQSLAASWTGPGELHPVATAPVGLHVSVSRTFPVCGRHNIAPLVRCLRENLASVPSFTCMLSDLQVFFNEGRTRAFLGQCVRQGLPSVLRVIAAVDAALTRFGHPVYYEHPRPHVSLAWATDGGRALAHGGPVAAALDAAALQGTAAAPLLCVEVAQVHCRAGNQVFALDLASQPACKVP